MVHDLFSSLASFESVSLPSLMVADATGAYRPAMADEILQAAQQLLAARVRGSRPLASPAAVRDFLRVRLGALPHEMFAVVHLDAVHAVIDYVEMFRGTLTQTSIYPREVAKDALMLNSRAVLLVHCHPSGKTEPSPADQMLTRTLAKSLDLVDVQVLDHLIVAGNTILSMAETGLL